MTAITATPGPRRRGFAGSDGPTARSLPGPIESGIESRGEPQEVHGRYGVRGGSRSVEGLARADDQSVVLLRRQEVASPRIRETPVHFALQLDGRSKIAGLEGRLVEVEQRFDEEGVIRGEARNLGDAVLLPVQ